MTVSPSMIVRADLLKLIERELLGPRYGHDEEIKGTPRAAYVVGALAPVTIDPSIPTVTSSESGDPNETGVAITDGNVENSEQRGVSVNTDEAPGAADEDEERDEGPKGALTHPSSMGLRFQVPLDCGVLAVKATWGRYETFRQEDNRRPQSSVVPSHSVREDRRSRRPRVRHPRRIGSDHTRRVRNAAGRTVSSRRSRHCRGRAVERQSHRHERAAG